MWFEKPEGHGTVVWSLSEWRSRDAPVNSLPKCSETIGKEAEKPAPKPAKKASRRKGPKTVKCKYPSWIEDRMRQFKESQCKSSRSTGR